MPVCFVAIETSTGDRKEFYFVKNSVYILGLNFMTIDSPIGHAVFGKTVGAEFSYQSGDTTFSGKVLEVS
jgi:transcription elongation GreA/GreB family factor